MCYGHNASMYYVYGTCMYYGACMYYGETSSGGTATTMSMVRACTMTVAVIGTCQWAPGKTWPTEAIEARILIGPSAGPEKSSSEYKHHPQPQYVLRSWKKSTHCPNGKGTWSFNVEEYDVQSYRHARQVLWTQLRQSPYSKPLQRKPQNRCRAVVAATIILVLHVNVTAHTKSTNHARKPAICACKEDMLRTRAKNHLVVDRKVVHL